VVAITSSSPTTQFTLSLTVNYVAPTSIVALIVVHVGVLALPWIFILHYKQAKTLLPISGNYLSSYLPCKVITNLF
jgi:hypothetical protein